MNTKKMWIFQNGERIGKQAKSVTQREEIFSLSGEETDWKTVVNRRPKRRSGKKNLEPVKIWFTFCRRNS